MTIERLKQITFILLAVSTVSSLIAPPVALAMGLILALGWGNPYPVQTASFAKRLLQWSVVGLGFGMNLQAVWAAGRTGFGFTVGTITVTLFLGWWLGRLLKVEATISQLISSGTAICGGSAIAAVGSVLEADARSMSVALATVFVLNSVALFIFPPLGHLLGMDQQSFGLWSAIAIHDTSSVVGAAAKYGDQALEIATTVKLTRALWIVPISLAVAWRRRSHNTKIKWPWFILFFVGAAAVRTFLPQGGPVFDHIHTAAKLGLTLTLFLIGAGLSRDALRSAGVRPMILGVLLWLVVSTLGLVAVSLYAG